MSVTAYKYFRFPFAVSGDVAAIPDTVQVDGSISYPQGFGPDYALDPATQPAALNIPRDKSNQLYLDITQGMKYTQEGKVPQWIAAADNGGVAFSYDFLATVLYTDGYIYQSVVAANNATPGASANWVRTRIRLGANTNFYVATAGNNSNSGLVVGSPWLTPTYAVNFIRDNYDLNGFVATVNLAAGTYAGVVASGAFMGAASEGGVVLKGATSTTTILTAGTCANVTSNAKLTLDTLRLTGGSFGIITDFGGICGFKNVDFGAQSSHHMNSSLGGIISCFGNYTISGAASAHLATNGGVISINTFTATISGSPNFNNAFAFTSGGFISSSGMTFTGTVTGVRYSSTVNGIIQTSGGGANYFPGNAAGITLTGGQYA